MDNTEIKILELPKILDRRGNLSFVEQSYYKKVKCGKI